jgi:hypothetical protein
VVITPDMNANSVVSANADHDRYGRMTNSSEQNVKFLDVILSRLEGEVFDRTLPPLQALGQRRRPNHDGQARHHAQNSDYVLISPH